VTTEAPPRRVFVSNTEGPDPLAAARKTADERLKLRYVAFDDGAGVFLGVKGSDRTPVWSRIDPHGLRTAPTFASRDEFTRHLADHNIEITTIPYRMVQVVADLDRYYASKESIAKALLPVW
jgi:sugar phosphate isomerase/epimerase